jgi:hypothetical protein
MRRALITGFAVLLAAVLMAPAALAATQVRQAQYEWPVPTAGVPGTPSPGAITLDFIFKNKRAHKKKFTPRQLTRIGFSKLYLICSDHMTFTRQLFLTETFETMIKLKKAPPPHTDKPKPNRYAFRFAYDFPSFTGTIEGTIDKVNDPRNNPKPTPPRAHGHLLIEDLDADPGHPNCVTAAGPAGPLGWSDLSLTTL